MQQGDLCFVSGVSGYLGSWLAKELLEQGFCVRGSVRSLSDEARNATLRELLPGIELVPADLRSSDGWAEAVKGVKWVFHVASPQAVKSEQDRTGGAVLGTKHLLQAAFAEPSVRKVVITSSEAAVAYGHARRNRAFDENDWTNIEGIGKDADYMRSKTEAERLAWNTANDVILNPRKVTLSTVNPALILGPSLVPWGRFSLNLLSDISLGKMPILVDMKMGVVDVRDCARMHIAVMTDDEANGKRHLSLGAITSFYGLAYIIKRDYAYLGLKPGTFVAPNWLARILSFISADVKSIWSRIGVDITYKPQRPEAYIYQHQNVESIVHDSMAFMLKHSWLPTTPVKSTV